MILSFCRRNFGSDNSLIMKKPILILLAFFIAAGLFLLGWHLGQSSATKVAGEFISAQIFGNAYSQIFEDELLIEQIDSGRIEDAKNSVYLRMDGNILSLNSQLEITNSEIPVSALKILLQMENDTKYGSKEQRANIILARVAKYRVEHPWKYSGKMPIDGDAEVEAKLAAVLKQASQSQK